MPPSIFLATPCYGGVCLQGYAESILSLIPKCAENGIWLVVSTTENESLITRARNLAVAHFLQLSDADYFMFVDADIHFHPDDVLRLMRSGHDVAVASYPKKSIMWEQGEKSVLANEGKDLSRASSSLVMNFKADTNKIVDGFAEVYDGPTGFMMIKREVLQKMSDHYKELQCVNDHAIRQVDNYVAIFDTMIDPVSKRYLSEDYAFCRRWQQMGGKIHTSVMTILGHVGNLRFTGSMDLRA